MAGSQQTLPTHGVPLTLSTPLVGAAPTVPASQASVRQQNLSLISCLIFGSPTSLTRATLATRTGLGRATVSRLINELIGAGIVHEKKPEESLSRGRPGTPLAPAPRTVAGIGLEANVDFVAGRAIDLAGTTLAEFRLSGLDLLDSPETMLTLLGDSAASMISSLAATGVRFAGASLGVPGLVNTENHSLLVAPNLGWSEFAPLAMLGERWNSLGIDTQIHNDADLQSLAAAFTRPGCSRTDATFLYIAGDVGIGGSILTGGALTRGSHGWAGEIGHLTVDPVGPQCSCGSVGCLEAFAGQASILKAAGLSRESSVHDLIQLLREGDEAAATAVEKAGWALGVALSDVINVVDISRVVFGTSLGSLLPWLRPHIESGLTLRVIGAKHRGIELVQGPMIALPACTGGAFNALHPLIADPSSWIDLTS
ncbi:ROK family transcriptional regulator [Schaalia sp. ZJ1691]|uniref:ROK family transcriptional regulator n=1 Tax=Schaalia sp. ZJ1691 TaxID=2709404 RepID=UPI0013EB105C|nr:ROK family transcriptional regulator [Schaalia sp. ZJ1691]